MNRYIIKNCPCYCEELLSHNFSTNTSEVADKGVCMGSISNSDYHCQNRTDCLLKRIYEDVKTVYKTPEYFEELTKKGDKEQELIESAWHNVAHMVISKLDIQEVE